MVKWQVQDQAWREGSHGGNEVFMSKRLVWRCFGGMFYWEGAIVHKIHVLYWLLLALGKRILVIYGGHGILEEQKRQYHLCIEVILNPGYLL